MKQKFWFYKKSKKHFAIQLEKYVKDITDDILIPIDNFNYQIEVGLIEDMGVK